MASQHQRADVRPFSPGRALQPATRALSARPALLPALAERALPAVMRSLTAVTVGLAVEYALRALANRALGALAAPLRRAGSSRSLPTIMRTRTVITELVVIESARRRS